MSRHDGRILFQRVNVDFSVNPLNTVTFFTVVPSMGSDCVRFDMYNSSNDCIAIAVGAVGSEEIVGQIGPGCFFQASAILVNKFQRISIQSTYNPTLNSGLFGIAIYN